MDAELLKTVNFALGQATVRILFKYSYQQGDVYHVEDIETGHRDFVGVEYLKPFHIAE